MTVAGGKERIMPSEHWDWSIPVPMSQGWKIEGKLVFVGGQIAADAHGNALARGDIAGQTRIVFENIEKVLVAAGAGWADVVKLNTYYLYDGPAEGARQYWEDMTRVRLEFLADPGPAATAVRVAGLAYDGLLIEAEAIAYIGDGSETA
jgi:enamine deaminase RidA (YjgF/YER057c/UK114 family)